MEQDIIDSSKFKISLLSLDSRFADQKNTDGSSFKLSLSAPMKNIMRVRLASIEIPLIEHLFSERYGNLTFAVRMGASPGFIKCGPLSPGNYTASSLVGAVQAALQAVHPGFTVFLDPLSGFVTIRNASITFEIHMYSYNTKIAERPTHWGLGYYLGFRKGRLTASPDIGGSYVIKSTSILNIQTNQYYLLSLDCPNPAVNVQHRLLDGSYKDAFAKIIIKDGQFTIGFDDNANLLRKEFTFLAPVTIPFFQVSILNPYGEPVDMLNVDWSVTLEITEVVNSKTYKTIQRTYNRE